MDINRTPRDLPQVLFSILIILTLLASAIWLLYPFLLSIIWAGLIVTATWPLFTVVQRRLGGNRLSALVLMMVFLTLIFLFPLIFSAGMLSILMEKLLQWLTHIDISHLPRFDFLEKIPAVGHRIHEKWLHLIANNQDQLFTFFRPWIIKFITLMMKEVTHFGTLFINGLLMLFACLVFYLHGKNIASGLRKFAWRIARERGERAVILAGNTVQAVAMGVVLTAVIQSVVAGLGLLICQVPSVGVLAGITFVLCLMQLGPIVIMLPAAIWLIHTGHHWNGVLLLILAFIAGSLDNILKPIFIKRSANTSLLLIMAGVIGGMLTWGMIGLMVGPVLLSVSWTLLSSWVKENDYQTIRCTTQ